MPRIPDNVLLFSLGASVLIASIRYFATKTRTVHCVTDTHKFLDWLADDTPVLDSPQDVSDSATHGEHSLVRGMAALGMIATSPRSTRMVKSVSSLSDHPATENDELADEVVHLKRRKLSDTSRHFPSLLEFS